MMKSYATSHRRTGPKTRVLTRKRAAVLLTLPILGLLALQSTADDGQSLGELLGDVIRRLCDPMSPDAKGNYAGFWESRYTPGNDYLTPPSPPGPAPGPPGASPPGPPPPPPSVDPPSDVAYVLPLRACPEDLSDKHRDPGHAFFDAAAVLMTNICGAHKLSGDVYSTSFHAIVHPNAVICMGPDGTEYDRVKVLQDLGYTVNVWGSDVDMDQVHSNYLKDNLPQDVTIDDLNRFKAFTMTNHKMVVLIDWSTIMMKSPEAAYKRFLENNKVDIVYTKDLAEVTPVTRNNQGVSTGFIALKPSVDTYKKLNKLFTDEIDHFKKNGDWKGWGGKGFKDFRGALGSRGLLSYYVSLNGSKARELDKCKYGNANDDPYAIDNGQKVCRDHNADPCEDCTKTDINQILIAQTITKCGAPWDCAYDEAWKKDNHCRDFHRKWYEERLAFETLNMNPQSDRLGTYHTDVFLGYCHGPGWTGYDPMLPDSGDCLGEMQSVLSSFTVPGGSGEEQAIELTTQKYTGNSKACVRGRITVPALSPPYAICIVIDVSGSTGGSFSGVVGDVNGDGKRNTILDAEIGAVKKFIESMIADDSLDNSNVDIGIVKFSATATYLGHWGPRDPNNPKEINPEIMKTMKKFRAGGITNFDDALDKTVKYFKDDAPKGRTNMLYFLSDGKPNVCGDGDEEDKDCTTGAYIGNNHDNAIKLASEIKQLEAYNVIRHAIGVGTGSDVRTGYGLDKIDNTGDKAEQVKSVDALVNILNANPVTGTVMNFTLWVNGVPDPRFSSSDLVSGSMGYSYGTFLINGLDPAAGVSNTIVARASMDLDGKMKTLGDQYEISTTAMIDGTVSNAVA